METLEIEKKGYSENVMPTEDKLWDDAQKIVKAVRVNTHDIDMNRVSIESALSTLENLKDIFGNNIVLDEGQDKSILDLLKSIDALMKKLTSIQNALKKVQNNVSVNSTEIEAYKLEFQSLENQFSHLVFTVNSYGIDISKLRDKIKEVNDQVKWNRVMNIILGGVVVLLFILFMTKAFA